MEQAQSTPDVVKPNVLKFEEIQLKVPIVTSVEAKVDSIPLSRPKRNISRDFSDGVLAAEVVANYCPKLVDMHNYSAANSLAQKIYNWNTLNNKVFRRLNFFLSKEDIEAVANAEPMLIERILKLMKYKIAKHKPGGYGKGHQENANEDHSSPSGFIARPSQNKAELYPMQFQSASYLRGSSPRNGSSNKHLCSLDRSQGQRNCYTSHSLGPQDAISNEKDMQRELQKDAKIRELTETVELLEAKVAKLEQLVRLKDHKIQVLSGRSAR